MARFKSVGVLLRDPEQSFPLEYLRAAFNGAGGTLHLLNEGAPPGPLDLIIAMGGDGTVLKALDLDLDCPVLAINYGTVGFLTAGDRTELETLIQRLLGGDYIVSERIVLRCEYPGGSANVVNEVVLRSNWRMVNVEVSVDDARIRTIRADGVIVGTPTGSTGYLLSTGSPIVMPDAEIFILDGLNEYNFTSRPLVLPATSRIHLGLPTLLPGQEVWLYVDGTETARIDAGQQLHLSLSPRRARLIFFDKNYFFHNLSSRLSWN
jgi:NAD+ kinase